MWGKLRARTEVLAARGEPDTVSRARGAGRGGNVGGDRLSYLFVLRVEIY